VAPDPLLPWLFAVRVCLNGSALLSIGLALHAGLRIVEQDRRRAVLVHAAGAAVFALLAGLARLALLNAQLGDGLGDAFNPDNAELAWTILAPATITLSVGVLAVVISAASGITTLGAVGALAIAGSFALTGHTQSLEQPGPMPIVAAAHVLIAGFWVAAPLTLFPSATLPAPLLVDRLKRFSAIAVAAIPALVVLGIWLAWVLAGGLNGLFGTTYGRLLLAKLAVSLVAVGMGALNHAMITRQIASRPTRGRMWLGWTLRVETAVFIAAVLIVSIATTFVGRH
jgi:putative copper export protein